MRTASSPFCNLWTCSMSDSCIATTNEMHRQMHKNAIGTHLWFVRMQVWSSKSRSLDNQFSRGQIVQGKAFPFQWPDASLLFVSRLLFTLNGTRKCVSVRNTSAFSVSKLLAIADEQVFAVGQQNSCLSLSNWLFLQVWGMVNLSKNDLKTVLWNKKNLPDCLMSCVVIPIVRCTAMSFFQSKNWNLYT